MGFENGHMTSLSAPSVSGSIVTSIAYDGFLSTALSWAGPIAGEVNWTYNDRFLIATETIGALPETTVNYSYDKDGLVTQAGDLTIARDPASGRVVSKTIGNIRESFEYNEFAELNRQTVELMSGSTVVETLYDVVYDDDGVNGDRDALGRITKKTEWIVSGDTPNGDGTARDLDSRTYDYGYNASGRPWLESVAVDGAVVSSYGYDDNGNRTSVELNWSQLGYSMEFDASLSEADTEYDEADKLLTYGTKSYSWNAFGQLSSMTDSSAGETTAYEYDLFGNLLSVGEGLHARLGLGGGFEKIHGSGRLAPRYVLEYAVNGSVARTLVPIADDLGSVLLVADAATGEIFQRLEYDTFGRTLEDSAPGVLPFGYGGGLRDDETTLARFGARDVNHETGRWLARDPVRFKSGSMNLFLHAGADPLNVLDVTGLATYRCSRSFLGPLDHKYVCMKRGKTEIWNGQTPSGNGLYSDGEPSNKTQLNSPDTFEVSDCEKVHEDDNCMDFCISLKLGDKRRPKYGFGPQGTDCWEWADETIKSCKSICGG